MPNKQIEDNFSPAVHGDKDAAHALLQGVLSGPLYVPERHQAKPLTDAPAYPNDFVYILGVRDKERTVVPVFSDASHLLTWAGNPFTFKVMSGKALFELVPEGWWVILNPGSEFEKDFSPWEIETLREGEKGIPAVLEELFADSGPTMVEVHPLPEGSYSELKDSLLKFALTTPSINRLHVLSEVGVDEEDQKVTRILVGVKLEGSVGKPEKEALQGDLTALAQRALIGDRSVRVLVADAREENLVLGAFNGFEPLYTKSIEKVGGILSKVLKGLKLS